MAEGIKKHKSKTTIVIFGGGDLQEVKQKLYQITSKNLAIKAKGYGKQMFWSITDDQDTIGNILRCKDQLPGNWMAQEALLAVKFTFPTGSESSVNTALVEKFYSDIQGVNPKITVL